MELDSSSDSSSDQSLLFLLREGGGTGGGVSPVLVGGKGNCPGGEGRGFLLFRFPLVEEAGGLEVDWLFFLNG